MPTRAVLFVFRLSLGLLILFAIGWQLSIHAGLGFPIVNFFSYFTNLANLCAASVLLVGAFRSVRGVAPSVASDRFRHLAVIYMTVVGVTFVTLLRNVDLGSLRPWINTLLHYVVPIVMVGEWLVDPPPHRPTLRDVLWGQLFPWLYLVYSLVRGAAIGWYPYPFLNPSIAGGYGAVAGYAVGIVVVFVITGAGLMALAPTGRPSEVRR